MKLRHVKIANFRNLVDVSFPVSDTTILVGENNCGKTALLDAIRTALTRQPTSKALPFTEYDYHMKGAADTPQTSPGISVELWFREDMTDEWPNEVTQGLSEIIQTDPDADLDYIGLRLTSQYDAAAKEMVAKTEFLALDGQPLGGRAAQPSNFPKFTNYVRVFYLSALRDSDDEFSPRSQYWGRILRDLKLTSEQQKEFKDALGKLNEDLLTADPKLEKVRASLDKVQKVLALGSGQVASIQALPVRPWDLMAKAEVIVKPRGADTSFPLSRHGQGMQSLAVLFLFQAYIDVLLKPSFTPHTEALLALEEPEAHLHPQATRALAASLNEITSQKIISSHSPYFIQEMPFSQIRMFCRSGCGVKVAYVKRSFAVDLPTHADLLTFVKEKGGKYRYSKTRSILEVGGPVTEKEYRALATIYSKDVATMKRLKWFVSDSLTYLTDDELEDLDTWAKRIRGEVLFARAWLLCEGQCEYLLLRYFAELMGTPFDNSGVSVIDFQNNGSAGSFVALATAFDIPWLLVCDNDPAGQGYAKEAERSALPPAEMQKRLRLLPNNGTDLEKYLATTGLITHLVEVFHQHGIAPTLKQADAGFADEVASLLRKNKFTYIQALIQRLRNAGADATAVPGSLKSVIEDITKVAQS